MKHNVLLPFISTLYPVQQPFQHSISVCCICYQALSFLLYLESELAGIYLSSQQINKEKDICLFIVYSVSSNYQCCISTEHLPIQTGSWSIWAFIAHIQQGTSRRPPSQQALFFFHGVRFPLNTAGVAENRVTFTEQLNKLQRHYNGMPSTIFMCNNA